MKHTRKISKQPRTAETLPVWEELLLVLTKGGGGKLS